MNETIIIVGASLAAYLYGAVPFGYLFVRLFKGVDVREYGSKNVGATNVARVMGTWAFFPVFALDFSKGFLPVFFLPPILFPAVENRLTVDISRVSLGFAAIVGHLWPVFLRFRGGKGVATAAGVLLAISPIVTASAVGVWAVLFLTLGYVSLASIVAAVSLPSIAVAAGLIDIVNEPITFAFFVAVALMVLFTHRSNIRRLLSGSENKVLWKRTS